MPAEDRDDYPKVAKGWVVVGYGPDGEYTERICLGSRLDAMQETIGPGYRPSDAIYLFNKSGRKLVPCTITVNPEGIANKPVSEDER